MESSLVPLHVATVLNMIEGNAFNQFPANLEQFITDFWKIKNFPCALYHNTLLTTYKFIELYQCFYLPLGGQKVLFNGRFGLALQNWKLLSSKNWFIGCRILPLSPLVYQISVFKFTTMALLGSAEVKAKTR